MIDSAAGFAYFGTSTSPGIVVKVRLSDFTRVGALTLHRGEDAPSSAVIDPAAGFATSARTGPRVCVKVRLSDFTRVGGLTLNAGENYLRAAVIDSARWLRVLRHLLVSRDRGEGAPRRISPGWVCDAQFGEDYLSCAVIDPAAGFAYFGTSTQPGWIVKIGLAPFMRVGSLTSRSGEDFSVFRRDRPDNGIRLLWHVAVRW